MTPSEDYLKPLTAENAAVLFIDNQTSLMLGVQSMDTTLLIRNTEGLAKLAKLFALPVVLTTTGPQDGPAGPLHPSITQTFPDAPVIGRTTYFNAMSDPHFAAAVDGLGRDKIIVCGVTSDYCLVYPVQSLIARGFHVLVVVDASGSWTRQIEDAALSRMAQMGATLTNVQSLAGELQNSLALQDATAAERNQRPLLDWFAHHSPAPALTMLTYQARQPNAK